MHENCNLNSMSTTNNTESTSHILICLPTKILNRFQFLLFSVDDKLFHCYKTHSSTDLFTLHQEVQVAQLWQRDRASTAI